MGKEETKLGGEEEGGAEKRANWGGQLEFILTLIGFAVGLGNVWRFPYLCYQNGGGAFLIPYFLMLLLIGIPTFYMEVAFGQFASLGPISVWRASPIFKGIGHASIIVAIMINVYYNVIIAWCLYYFFASMTDTLPWTKCGNWWNTPNCYDGTTNRTENATIYSPSEEFYCNKVLRMSPGIEYPGIIVWQLAVLLLLTWVIIFAVLLKGISSLGKVSYFVSLFPYLLFTIMLIRGATLDGAAQGIEFYIKPDFSKLANAKVWSDAATQIFYSLGCCMSTLVSMASFNPFKNNIHRDSLLIPLINCGTSVYAGFVIFSVLGYMAKIKGVSVADVAADGPGLVFVVYPEGLSTMPAPYVWSALFFFMMCTLGFSSQFSTAEGIIASIIDEIPSLGIGRRPLIFRAVYCTLAFLLGLPMVTQGGFYLFNIMNNYSGSYPLLVIGGLELVTISWVYGYSNFAEDISMMIGSKPGIFWKVCWCVVSPLTVLLTIISMAVQQQTLTLGDYVYPAWANSIAWLIVATPMTACVLYFLCHYMYRGGWAALVACTKPGRGWGPALPEDRTGKYAMPEELVLSISGTVYDDPNSGVRKRKLSSIDRNLANLDSGKVTDKERLTNANYI